MRGSAVAPLLLTPMYHAVLQAAKTADVRWRECNQTICPLCTPNASSELPHNASALSSPFMGAPSATSSLKFKTYDPSTARQKRTPIPGTAVLRPATPTQSNSRVNPSPAAPSETYAGVLSSRAQTPKDPTVTAVCKTVEDFGSRRYVRSSRPKRPLHAKYRQGCAQRGDAGRLLATHAR